MDFVQRRSITKKLGLLMSLGLLPTQSAELGARRYRVLVALRGPMEIQANQAVRLRPIMTSVVRT